MANTLSFDEAFYLSKNPDVAAAVSRGIFTSGAQHYELNGRFEARNPNAFFDTAFYLGQYPDVARAGINPLTHFLTFGVLENRATNATELFSIDKDGNGLLNEFDAAKYLLNNQDVANGIASGTIKSAYQHFIQFGQFEGRVAPLTNGTTISGPFTNTGVPVNTGSTIALTTGVDNAVGTVNNDTFVGEVNFSNADPSVITGTLSVNDVISGGAGNDTLSLTVTGGGANYATTAIPAASINSVENINIRAVMADSTNVVRVSAATPGLTSVNSDRSTSAVSFTNVASGTTVGVIGNGVVANGATSAQFVDAATSATVNVSGGTTGGLVTLTGTGLTSTTINSTGVANTLGGLTLAASTTTATINAASNLTTGTLTADGLKTLNVNGSAANVNVGTLVSTVTTVDASGLTTGGLTAKLDAAITSFKGGQGSDIITTAAVTSTTAGIINAGAGNDTLVVAAASDVNTAAKGALYTGFETLRNASASNLDVSTISGITSVEVTGSSGATKLTAAQASNIKVLDTNAGSTFALATATGTSDVLGLTLAPASASAVATPIDVTGLTVTGFETLNVVSSSGLKGGAVSAGNDLAFAAAGDLTAINVSGEYDLSLSTANLTKAVTITSSQTGTANLNVTGDLVKGSVVNTTANADVITTTGAVTGTTGEFVTYNAGAGNDTINTTLAALNNTSNANASLKIDGGAGVDTLKFGTTDASFVDNNFQYVTGVEKIVLSNTTALSFTSGGYVNTNFASGLDLTTGTTADGATQTINLSNYTGAAKITSVTGADGATNADNVLINTGSGSDTITVTASSFVGAATNANGNITVNAGAGNDTISVTTGTLTAGTNTNAVIITGGAGADKITVDHVNAGSALGNIKFNIADGDSTAAARDTITGFKVGANTAATISDTLDLTGSATIAADTTGTNGADAGALKSHAITNGIVTFGAADTYAGPATVINQANLGDALSYLKANFTTANTTVAFAYDSDSNGSADATIVFQAGTAGTVVELVGVVGASLNGTNGTANGLIHIA